MLMLLNRNSDTPWLCSLTDCEVCCLLFFGDVCVGTTTSCCSLRTKSVPVDPAAPYRMFLSSDNQLHSNFNTKVCVSTCPRFTCTPAENTTRTFYSVFGKSVKKKVPTRCDSQCKLCIHKFHSDMVFVPS